MHMCLSKGVLFTNMYVYMCTVQRSQSQGTTTEKTRSQVQETSFRKMNQKRPSFYGHFAVNYKWPS